MRSSVYATVGHPSVRLSVSSNDSSSRGRRVAAAGRRLQQILIDTCAVVKVRGARGAQPPCFDFAPPLLESEPSLPTAGPKLLNSTKNHNVRCRINKF